MAKLEMNGVSFGYGSQRVLDGISLQFDSPGLTLILGPNGCGKSTLLRLLAGLLHPSFGDIKLNDQDLAMSPRLERAKQIAWLSQQWPASSFHQVLEYVSWGRYPHHGPFQPLTAKDWEVARASLAALDILSLEKKTVAELSGGERQLVRLAQVLTQNTKILLLDEPFSGLDVRHRAALWKLLMQNQRIVIAVTHELWFLDQTCPRSVLLKNGRVIADGVPEEVLTPRNIEKCFEWRPPNNWKFSPTHFVP